MRAKGAGDGHGHCQKLALTGRANKEKAEEAGIGTVYHQLLERRTHLTAANLSMPKLARSFQTFFLK